MAGRDDPTEEIELEEQPAIPNINQSVIVFALPEYYSNTSAARRSDPRVPREKIGSLSNTDDMAGAVRKLATSPGAYLAELRFDGRVMESKVIELKPRSEVVQSDFGSNGHHREPPTQQGQAGLPSEVEARLSRIENALLAMAEKGNGVRATEPPRKPVDELRDSLELVREFQNSVAETVREVVRQNPATPAVRNDREAVDDEERTLMLLLKDRALRERALAGLSEILTGTPPESSKGWVDVIGDILQSQPVIINRTLNIADRIVSRFLPEQADSEDEGEETGEEQLDAFIASTDGDAVKIVNELIPDLVLNAPLNRALILIHAFVRRFPGQGAAMFGMMRTMKPDDLLNMLASYVEKGDELKQLAHAKEWLAALQRALAGGAP
jgi:hypothetical protein